MESKEEIKSLAKSLVTAVKKITPELAKAAGTTPFEIVISNQDQGIAIEISVEWDKDIAQVADDGVNVLQVPEFVDPQTYLEELTQERIKQALQATRGNKRRAAEMLGISMRTLQRKLKLLNL